VLHALQCHRKISGKLFCSLH